MYGDYGFNDLKLKLIHNETDIAFSRVRFHKDLVEPHHIETPIGVVNLNLVTKKKH